MNDQARAFSLQQRLRLLPLAAVAATMSMLVSCGESPAPPPAEVTADAVTSQPPAARDIQPGPTVATRSGEVRGFIEDGIIVFKGVRYGADTAQTRFAAPMPPAPWTGVRDAQDYGPSAPQEPYPPGTAGGLFESWVANPAPPNSEDTLFLNVWTPALSDSRKRPVMVWFHGGGFTRGSGSSNAYDGVRLARRGDVVVVTVNHRLNLFGHLYLAKYGPQFTHSGNAGILDLVLSLEWVRDNIETFGGDPANVTIFGESGGGSKVSVLMAMDNAKGLFHRAVIESGGRLENTDRETAAAGTQRLVQALGLTQETIGEILTMPTSRIQRAAAEVIAAGHRATWNGPVYDRVNFRRQPFAPDAPPQATDVPLLIGTTRTEASLFIGARDPATFDLSWEMLPEALARSLPGADVDRVIAQYRRLNPDYSPSDLLFTAATDAGFLLRSIRIADRKADQAGAPVYFYMLNWATPVQGGKWGSPHALDIGMVFDNVAKSASMSGIGEEQQAIADMMSESWLAFARTGDPNNAVIPHWPAYTSKQRSMMLFDIVPEVKNDPHGEQRRVFEGDSASD